MIGADGSDEFEGVCVYTDSASAGELCRNVLMPGELTLEKWVCQREGTGEHTKEDGDVRVDIVKIIECDTGI